jgi:hypothetical protein
MLKNNNPFINIFKENTYKKKMPNENNNIHHNCYLSEFLSKLVTKTNMSSESH